LKAYDIMGKSLVENMKTPIPEDLDYKVFLKFDTPDSVRAQFEKSCYYTFDLDPGSKDQVNFHIIMETDAYKQWLTGNTMLFQWNGNMFISSIVFQKEENTTDETIPSEPYKR
ncbi:MAG TPA: hypothetical protein VK808_11285, partial [Bacteroidia bacterium]|nr:hypothetical protein [Bacteroidia bacterium]